MLQENTEKFRMAGVVAIVVLLMPAILLYAYHPSDVQLKKNLNELPATIGVWQSKYANNIKNDYLSIPAADLELLRIYRNDKGREARLYVGYYKSQNQGREMVDYRLEWLYKAANKIAISTPFGNIHVNKATFGGNTNQNFLSLYWYDINGRIIASNYLAKAITILDGLMHQRTNGAIIIVSTNITSGDTQKSLDDVIAFVRDVVPVLDDYLP